MMQISSNGNCVKRIAFLLFLFCSFPSLLFSQVVLTDDKPVDHFVNEVEFLLDSSQQLTINDFTSGSAKHRLKQLEGKELNFGYTNATVWLHFFVTNKTDKQWYFEIAHPLVDSAIFYNLSNNSVKKQGRYFPLSERDIRTNFKTYSLDLKKDSTAEYYLKINCSESLLIQARFATLKQLYEKKHLIDFAEGIYHGFILMIILYNLFIFFVIRDRVYLYYIAFALSIELSVLYAGDYLAEIFWPDNPWLTYYGTWIYVFTGVFTILFSVRFLNTKIHFPKTYKFALFLIYSFIGTGILNLIGQDYYATMVIEYLSFVSMIFLIVIAFKALKGGWKPARFFLLAWTPLLIGLIILLLRDLEYIPANTFTFYAFQIGSALEILLFSLALASRIREYKRKKDYAQKQLFKSLEEKEKLILDQNKKLEQKVKERTHTLEQKNTIISNSIDYAKVIQQAILTSDDEVRNLLPDSFAFHLPKSVLSGDFFWISQYERQIRLAAVDCTGHGVPAALMSLLGFNMLENLSKSPLIETPAGVLDMLDHYVHLAVKTKDMYIAGMSLSLIQLSKEENKLVFAGARSMIYIVREGELMQLKSDELSIGFQYPVTEDGFKDHSFDLQKGDMIYLFSDGFADQFGGEKREKFFYNRFRHLLISISSYPTDQQREMLSNAYHEWKGDEEQVDDVLVLGVRW
jgi:two-component system, sensor histidine kinase LadS